MSEPAPAWRSPVTRAREFAQNALASEARALRVKADYLANRRPTFAREWAAQADELERLAALLPAPETP